MKTETHAMGAVEQDKQKAFKSQPANRRPHSDSPPTFLFSRLLLEAAPDHVCVIPFFHIAEWTANLQREPHLFHIAEWTASSKENLTFFQIEEWRASPQRETTLVHIAEWRADLQRQKTLHPTSGTRRTAVGQTTNGSMPHAMGIQPKPSSG